jgi:hypothetical protein
MVNWSKNITSVLLTVLGVVLLQSEYLYAYISWANAWSARLFVIGCTIIIGLGVGLIRTEMSARIKVGTLTTILLNVALLAIGGFGITNDAVNGTAITTGSGIYVAYDTLSAISTIYTSKAAEFAIIVNTIAALVPTIVLIVIVVQIFGADDANRADVMITCGLILAVLLGFGFLGRTIGFPLWGQ